MSTQVYASFVFTLDDDVTTDYTFYKIEKV